MLDVGADGDIGGDGGGGDNRGNVQEGTELIYFELLHALAEAGLVQLGKAGGLSRVCGVVVRVGGRGWQRAAGQADNSLG